MTRLGFLLFFVVARAQAETLAPGAAAFDPQLITTVYSTALDFMEPRILEPVPVPQLTLWGLRGLTALDPGLTTEVLDGKLRLVTAGRVLFAEPPPEGLDAAQWAGAAVRVTGAAYVVSAAVRHVGDRGIVQSFFDELFNHLDPYSRYIGPEEAAADIARRNGRAGLGLTLTQRGGVVLIQEAIADGPAALAGIKAGDSILAVDGGSVRGKSAREVDQLILGPEGSEVRLTWRRGDGRAWSAVFARAMVPPETVYSQRQRDLLIIRVTSFNHSTAAHLAQAIAERLSGPRHPAGLVLDLRSNLGGVLQQAVSAADTLLPAGVVAYTVGRDPDATHVWRSEQLELRVDLPIVVLVDGRTASAAEVLAAALADRGRAVVVGSSTLGKGLVQTVAPLPDGGELFVTWSRILAPRGWPIQGLGLLPQVCTSLGGEALQRQLATLAEGSQPMEPDIARHRAARAPMPAAIMVAIRQACPSAGDTERDMEAARVLVANPAAYAAALLPPLADPAMAR